MTSTLESTDQASPSLVTLPVELKLEIISYLPHDEYPTRACLRRTHPSFFHIIPKSDIRSRLALTKFADQLLETELEYAYLFPPEHYPCYLCVRVLPLGAFDGTVEDPDQDTKLGDLRCCHDCRRLDNVIYKRSFVELLRWIAFKCTRMPMPPSRPEPFLLLSDGRSAVSYTSWMLNEMRIRDRKRDIEQSISHPVFD